MGIRNAPVPEGYFLNARLITPHGDSERSPWPAALMRWATHNPSWGFGTTVHFVNRAGTADS